MEVQRLENAFVNAPEAPEGLPGGYVVLNDLLEVLQDYFGGTLDTPKRPDLICRDLMEWHPNSLWCQVDSGLLEECFAEMPRHLFQAIARYFCPGLLVECFSEPTPEPQITDDFGQALERLAAIVYLKL